jgi:hypothetical protein
MRALKEGILFSTWFGAVLLLIWALVGCSGCAEVERAGITQLGPFGFTVKIPDDWYAKPRPEPTECRCLHWIQKDGKYECKEPICPIHRRDS